MRGTEVHHRCMEHQAGSTIRVFRLLTFWMGMIAVAIAAADGSNASGASSEGEGMRANSVLLNGQWEFSIGDGDERAEKVLINMLQESP